MNTQKKTEQLNQITLPTLHTNGTSARELTKAYSEAAAAVGAAIKAAAKTGPNGRDYYCSPDSKALENAISEHCARMEFLYKIKEELDELARHCFHYLK